ncbi:MAG: substrate-binding domain-containing protein [Clostridiales bacterium]|nr:substrate-binding domain-containing protein [Clostridiales bacterium]
MRTKLKSVLLAGIIAAGAAAVPAYAENTESPFTVVSIPCYQGEEYFMHDWQTYEHLLARYADDKTPIPLSEYYDETMYATVPTQYKDREIEWYVSEELPFNDNTDDYEFYIMGKLSARGVISGDENGNAMPFSNITRAEATAIVMRLLGLDNFDSADSGFDDVDKDAWYAKVVTAARKAGIVSGDSDTAFNPGRNVSREEFTAMAARAVWYAGLQKEVTDNPKAVISEMGITDIDDISPWAYSAYAAMKYFNITDYDYIDNGPDEMPDDIYYARPKQPATRAEAAELLDSVCDTFQIYPSKTAVEFGFDKELPVIDGSTSTYPFTQAIYESLFSNGYYHPDKPQKHSKTHNSYQRLINGEVDAIIASVYPASDILEMAKEKGVELELVPIAYDAMIFFTNTDNSIEGLTSQQITEIYVDNKYDNWKDLGGPDALLYPYCRNNDSGSNAQMERHFLNGKEINEKILKETTSTAMADILTDVMGSETDDPTGYGLGYSIYYYFRNMNAIIENEKFLKLLAIDGVYPTDETIADGSYPLSNNTYVVFKKSEPENSKARRFADFMLSMLGQDCVRSAGFGPLYDNRFEFELEDDSDEFCMWEVENYSSNIDVYSEYFDNELPDGTADNTGKYKFTIIGKREGTTTVTCRYNQYTDDGSVIPLKSVTYTLSVAKDGQITVLDRTENDL